MDSSQPHGWAHEDSFRQRYRLRSSGYGDTVCLARVALRFCAAEKPTSHHLRPCPRSWTSAMGVGLSSDFKTVDETSTHTRPAPGQKHGQCSGLSQAQARSRKPTLPGPQGRVCPAPPQLQRLEKFVDLDEVIEAGDRACCSPSSPNGGTSLKRPTRESASARSAPPLRQPPEAMVGDRPVRIGRIGFQRTFPRAPVVLLSLKAGGILASTWTRARPRLPHRIGWW